MLFKVCFSALLTATSGAIGFMAPCSSDVGNSVGIPRSDCRNPLDSVTCRDKWCCKRRVYAEENFPPPAGDCICVNPWQQCGEELKPFFYSHPKPDCACCECNVKCVRLLGAELCPNGLPPIGECKDHTDVYCCNPSIEAKNKAIPDGMLKPMPCRCYNGRCPGGWENKGKCKECCVA